MHILFYSSCFFILPCIYAFDNELYILSFISLLNTLCSAILWYNYHLGHIRNIDVFFARASFCIYSLYSFVLIYERPFLIFPGIVSWYLIVFYFIQSKISLVYHLDFHITSILVNLYVIQLCNDSKYINNW